MKKIKGTTRIKIFLISIIILKLQILNTIYYMSFIQKIKILKEI